ncbi:MAG: hypothetical protein ABF665_00965 [Gluconacetobacter sp.]
MSSSLRDPNFWRQRGRMVARDIIDMTVLDRVRDLQEIAKGSALLFILMMLGLFLWAIVSTSLDG